MKKAPNLGAFFIFAEKEGFFTPSKVLFLLGFSSPIKMGAPKYAPPFKLNFQCIY